jgi:hypothetical protein
MLYSVLYLYYSLAAVGVTSKRCQLLGFCIGLPTRIKVKFA